MPMTRSGKPAPVIRAMLWLFGLMILLTACAAGHGETRAPRARPAELPGATAATPRADLSTVGARLAGSLHTAQVRLKAPGVTAAVMVCGRMIWSGASGVTDLRSRQRATNRTLFALGSTTKTIIATMVMQQVQAGRLSLGARLSRFYPQLPDASEITVRMLLNMTSGLPDYLSNPLIRRTLRHRPRHRWTRVQVLDGLGGGLGPSQFAPGARYRYNDTNYIVLGGILQRLTGSSIEREFQRRIAGPAGMSSATFVRSRAATALMAHPYLRERDGALRDQWVPGFGVSTAVWGPVWTDGGLVSTTTDLARFASALLNYRLANRTSVAEMTRTGRSHYGFGIQSRSFGGHDWLGHYGAYGGYEAEDWTDLSRGVTFAVATDAQAAGQEPQLISDRIWKALVRAYDVVDTAAPTCSSPA